MRIGLVKGGFQLGFCCGQALLHLLSLLGLLRLFFLLFLLLLLCGLDSLGLFLELDLGLELGVAHGLLDQLVLVLSHGSDRPESLEVVPRLLFDLDLFGRCLLFFHLLLLSSGYEPVAFGGLGAASWLGC